LDKGVSWLRGRDFILVNILRRFGWRAGFILKVPADFSLITLGCCDHEERYLVE